MEFPALDITGQAGSPWEVDEVAREVAALVLDADPADVGVDVEVELPTGLEAAWAGACSDTAAVPRTVRFFGWKLASLAFRSFRGRIGP
ncbi:MAG: hypothetical protein LBG11_09325 [Bifidobacteriaceae bacterium]|nr:hypothetical protein [Bifidobacteriaceae bacterium]